MKLRCDGGLEFTSTKNYVQGLPFGTTSRMEATRPDSAGALAVVCQRVVYAGDARLRGQALADAVRAG